jgi:hypothetical protein
LWLLGLPRGAYRAAELHPAAGKGIIIQLTTAIDRLMLYCEALLFLSTQLLMQQQQKQQQQQ